MAKRKDFFDLKIKEWGGECKSRYLNVTRILPREWKYVRVWRPKIENGKAILRIECLYKEGEKHGAES